jgi:hypothetical protein
MAKSKYTLRKQYRLPITPNNNYYLNISTMNSRAIALIKAKTHRNTTTQLFWV